MPVNVKYRKYIENAVKSPSLGGGITASEAILSKINNP